MFTNVLVIWEEIPESTKIFKLAVSNEILGKLTACHGKYINVSLDDQELADWLSNAVEDWIKEGFEVKIEAGKTIELDSTQPRILIHTGYML